MNTTRRSTRSPVLIGVLLIIMGLLFLALNFSFLPLVGIILAIPAIGAGIYLLIKGSRGEPGGSPFSE
jgi:uncharacterized membrane protein HdeD (DUF308 family)